MLQTGKEEKFERDVRVFSIVLNAKELSVQIHRASPRTGGNLAYGFDELSWLEEYSKDQACHLVKNILDGYAIEELHGRIHIAFLQSDFVFGKMMCQIQQGYLA